ncbi:MAG: proton-conducting transporter transmembrane domain-containing protein, partial [Burkholderiales bacterium]
MDVSLIQPVDAAVTLAVAWIVLGIAALALARSPRWISGLLYPLGAIVALALAVTGVWAMNAPESSVVLVAGLPDLPFHVRVDSLSGFFLLLLGGVSFGISLFATAYFRDEHNPALVCLQYHVFLASMAFVLTADDAYFFMVAWESMALSSYFLVTLEHHEERNRKAGFIYLLIAHLGAISILLSFGVLQG